MPTVLPLLSSVLPLGRYYWASCPIVVLERYYRSRAIVPLRGTLGELSVGKGEFQLPHIDTCLKYLWFFIVPCCYIIILGYFLGHNSPIYIIFSTNLLTQYPVRVAVFCVFLFFRFLVPNEVQLPQNLLMNFLDQKKTSKLREETWATHEA